MPIKNKVNYKWLSFFLLLIIIGITIIVSFNIIYGWLIILFSLAGILKDWKELWAVIKPYLKSTGDTGLTQNQHLENSGDAFQAGRDQYIFQNKKRDKK
jgi:hypothetical protein